VLTINEHIALAKAWGERINPDITDGWRATALALAREVERLQAFRDEVYHEIQRLKVELDRCAETPQ
jgi:hypothetical protein